MFPNKSKIDLIMETLNLGNLDDFSNSSYNEVKLFIYNLINNEMYNLHSNFKQGETWKILNSIGVGYIRNFNLDCRQSESMVPNNLKVIGVCGKKFSGKDTFADYLCINHGYIKISFADTLKNICGILFNLSYAQLYGMEKEVNNAIYGLSARQILQFVGTEIFRDKMSILRDECRENFWVLCLRRKIEGMWRQNNNCHFVVPDVRFENEQELISNMGGKIIKIFRNVESNEYSNHASESFIDVIKFDYSINNNYSKEDLYSKTELTFFS
jgi:hypothetical protein